MTIAIDHWQFSGSRPYRMGVNEYRRMIDADMFDGRNVELVEGRLIEMARSNLPHGALSSKLIAKLYQAYGDTDWLHFNDTFVGLTPDTARAPDISIIRQSDLDGDVLTGAIVWLAVEISHSTLDEDLNRKRPQYARAGIKHYWVIDVEGRQVHRFAAPENGDYAEALISRFDEQLPLPGIAATICVD